jgi:hypothetical protein
VFGVLAGTMEKAELNAENKIKEKIRFHTEILRITSIGLLTIVGGTASLLHEGIFNGRRNFFIAAGISIAVVLARHFYKSFRTINHLIK